MHSQHDILTREEEKQLILQMKNGCRDSRDELLRKNHRLVASIANKYASNRHNKEDLFQEGYIGLMKAVEKFNPINGNKFSTYAVWWIKQRISRYIEDNNTIRKPVWFSDYSRRLSKLGDCSDEEAAAELNISMKTVSTLKNHKPFITSLDDKGYGEDVDIHSLIPDKSPGADKILEDKENSELAFILMESLNPSEKEVVMRRYGIEREKETFEMIGRYFRLTKERIRQIQLKAEEKMRKKAAIEGIEWFG